jgi:hypothetical protein
LSSQNLRRLLQLTIARLFWKDRHPTQVAREVYTGCVRGVLGHTTRILVTNQLQFVAGSDWVLFMEDGAVAEAGTYNELLKAGKGFTKLMKQAEVTPPPPPTGCMYNASGFATLWPLDVRDSNGPHVNSAA